MDKLQQLYAVYEEHVKNVEAFSVVLWADLDVAKIVEATGGVEGKLRQLKHLADSPVYELVGKEIAAFAASLPLMKDLKSEALRKRHYAALMEVRPARAHAPQRHRASCKSNA